MQVGRTLFVLWAVRGHSESNFRNFQRITLWLAFSALFWIAGAFLEPSIRFPVWVIAMLIEFVSPSAGFWVPGLGRSKAQDWDVSGDHMAERCGLFVIIALGESLLVTGATWAELEWSAVNIAAVIIGVVGSVAMWWIYFHIGAERARGIIENSTNPGRWARLAYTYLHILLIAGIIICAASDEIILKHPGGHADAASITVLLGGPAVFLLGNLLFKWTTAGWPPLSHMIGLALLAGLVPATMAVALPPLAIGATATLVLVLVAILEARWLPSVRDGAARRAEVLD
jgi:low temperature requirement protein LtrA